MQFTTLLATALPLVAAFPKATPTSSAPVPTGTADLEAICESQAYGYKADCPRCLHKCATSAYPDVCFFSVFTYVNGVQSQCQAQTGKDCHAEAIEYVCGQP